MLKSLALLNGVCVGLLALSLSGPVQADDSLVVPPQKSLNFKKKKAGDSSSVITQDQLDEQELEGELTPQSVDAGDPASGATFQVKKAGVVGVGTNVATGVGTNYGTPLVDVNGDGKIDDQDSIAAAEQVKAKSVLEQLASPAPAQDFQQTQDPMLSSLTNFFGSTGNVGGSYMYGTEATAGVVPCLECQKAFDNMPKIDTSKIPGWVSLNNDSRLSDTEKCYSSILLNNAKDYVRNTYGNRGKSGGACARGVRGSLDEAGMNRGGGLGNAIDFQTSGALDALGFRNVMDGSMTPDNAPVGSVLVFAGPKTDEYLRNPADCSATGTYVGHVTIKGDDGYFYTDGRTAQPAVANRRLVGVFVMSKCTKCPKSMKDQCAARPGGP